MNNGIHSVQGYTGYYLNTKLPVIYNIGNREYFISDYIVDTAYLETGQLTVENYTLMVGGVPVTVPENTLPNVFIVRGDELIKPDIIDYSSDRIIISGDFNKGDVAVLKTAFYDGWTVNGEKTVNLANMIGSELNDNTDEVIFKFNPVSFFMGAILSLIGIVTLIILIFLRRKINFNP